PCLWCLGWRSVSPCNKACLLGPLGLGSGLSVLVHRPIGLGSGLSVLVYHPIGLGSDLSPENLFLPC
ncbi:MAG TPA: hypothetical protein VFV43_01920, partial [Limnobacter sp.]|nr:hypothetical protein [Limnobacter sp.]